jgi:diacylglycerol O-acyltransferase / wax synthase
MASSERMDPVDVTWLRMDRPANLMIITGVLTLAGPVDLSRLEATLARRILTYRRFRERVELRGTDPWWCEDPHFDIAHHLKRARLPGAGGKTELQRFVAELAARPLDRAHPLWEFHSVEDYEGGAALVTRMHHAIADGIALVNVLLSLTDDRPDASIARRKRRAGKGTGGGAWEDRFGMAGRLLGTGMRISDGVLKTSLDLAAHPTHAIDYLRDGSGVAAELAYLLLMPTDTPTRFKGVPLGDKRVAWADPIALPEVKAVSRALGCSVNDLLLAAVTGALKDYLRKKGDRTGGVEIRALVPINLRPPGSTGEELGNRFGIIAVELPVGISSPLERLYEVRRRMEALKASYEPSVTLGLFAGLGYAPQVIQDKLFDLLLSRATAVMTNVPGPQRQLWLAGSELKQVIFWVPQSGNIGMGVSILSFNGKVHFGIITDAALVPDPEAITGCFGPEFERLVYFVLMRACDGA